MADTPYGYILSASAAALILAAAGVTRYTPIGVDGETFNYNGVDYWILENELDFGVPTANSPDGLHIVYSPSPEEVALGQPPEGIDWQKMIMFGIFGIVLFGAASLIGAFKK